MRTIGAFWVREPLIHFLVLASLAWVLIPREEPLEPDEDEVSIPSQSWEPVAPEQDSDRQNAMIAKAVEELGRPPKPEELKSALRRDVDRDLLAREAIRLGLDRDDPVVVDRLVQKLEVLVAGSIPEPDETTLRAFFQNEPEFRLQKRVGFTQVFMPESLSEKDLEKALSSLRNGAKPESIGGRIGRVPDARLDSLRRRVSRSIYQGVEESPLGEWVQVRKDKGSLFLRVDHRNEVSNLVFENVRYRVLEAWQREQRRVAVKSLLKELRSTHGFVP